jgi:hypothetical protein
VSTSVSETSSASGNKEMNEVRRRRLERFQHSTSNDPDQGESS